MARSRIIEFLPELYVELLPDFFDRPLSEERHATCDACAMCAPDQPVFPPEGYFSPDTKCCTFHPALPNYSVGGLLRDDSAAGAEGRRRIQAKIAGRVGVTPIGILPPARTSLLQRHGQRGFGRAAALVCPYFDASGGGCTVWAQREAECATWFCKHNAGLDGREFWRQLRDYLVGAHRVLSWHVLLELGFDADRIVDGFGWRADLDARDLDEAAPRDEDYRAIWGEWTGREAELYGTAFDLVRGLDRERYAALAGVAGEVELERLTKRYEAVRHPRLPPILLKNPMMRVVREADGSRTITSYEAGEPTRLRKAVFDLLDYFDGRRPTAEVRAAVLADTGLTLTDRFLTALYQHRLVIGADRAEGPFGRG